MIIFLKINDTSSKSGVEITTSNNLFLDGIMLFMLLQFKDKAYKRITMYEKDESRIYKTYAEVKTFFVSVYKYYIINPNKLERDKYYFRYNNCVIEIVDSEILKGLIQCFEKSKELGVYFDETIELINYNISDHFKVLTRSTFKDYLRCFKSLNIGLISRSITIFKDSKWINMLWNNIVIDKQEFNKYVFVEKIIANRNREFITEHKYDYYFYDIFIPYILERKNVLLFEFYLQELYLDKDQSNIDKDRSGNPDIISYLITIKIDYDNIEYILTFIKLLISYDLLEHVLYSLSRIGNQDIIKRIFKDYHNDLRVVGDLFSRQDKAISEETYDYLLGLYNES